MPCAPRSGSGHPGLPDPVQRIARATHAFPGYIAKIMQQLRRVGLVPAQRGMHGGFPLGRDPERISLLDVIHAVDPIQRISEGPLGIETHGPDLSPLHRRIDDVMQRMERAFAETIIAEILDDGHATRPLFDPDASDGDRV